MSAHAFDATISCTADAPSARVSRRVTDARAAFGVLDSALARTIDRWVPVTAFTLEIADAYIMVVIVYHQSEAMEWRGHFNSTWTDKRNSHALGQSKTPRRATYAIQNFPKQTTECELKIH